MHAHAVLDTVTSLGVWSLNLFFRAVLSGH